MGEKHHIFIQQGIDLCQKIDVLKMCKKPYFLIERAVQVLPFYVNMFYIARI